jgi:hypothetical protein
MKRIFPLILTKRFLLLKDPKGKSGFNRVFLGQILLYSPSASISYHAKILLNNSEKGSLHGFYLDVFRFNLSPFKRSSFA